MAAVSAAKSVSMIRERAAVVFSDAIWMLLTALSKRLCTAPSVARAPLICARAASACWMASCAPP